MSMSDCAYCWHTPCTCGHDYRSWTKDQLIKQIEMLLKVLKEHD